MPFHFQRLPIPDLILIEATAFHDDRGYFLETYKRSDFAAHGIVENFVQDNASHSARGVLRGLHFQRRPHAQGKLVLVLRGRIFDVGVDLRRGSPTFGQWASVELSAENHCLLYVPPGFAHGFYVLSDAADVTYKVTAEYAAEADAGIVWNDPDLRIQWPDASPRLSPKDAALPPLARAQLDREE